MTCDEFLEWMKSLTGPRMPDNPEVTAHLRFCPACRQIFALDACLEAGIQQAFTPHRLPAGLTESIDACVDRYAGIHQKPESPDTVPLLPKESETPGSRKTTLEKKGL